MNNVCEKIKIASKNVLDGALRICSCAGARFYDNVLVSGRLGEDCGGNAKSVSRLLLDQLLLFPVIVVLTVAITLLCGGKCALWQWWFAVVLTLFLPFMRNNWRRATFAGLCFLAVLFAVWLYAGISMTISTYDQLACHYPAIRMLMRGWNPIYQGTADAICAAAGHPASDFNKLNHIIGMPRAGWYFSAVSGFFAQNPFNLYGPLLLFMLIGSIAVVCSTLSGTNLVVKIVAALSMIFMIKEHHHAIDAAVALSFSGLMACQVNMLRGKGCGNIPLVAFSFWLCSCKQAGLMFCIILWSIFAIIILVRERNAWKNALAKGFKMAGVVFVLVLVANASPYMVNWVVHSHPLYPSRSFDTENHPAENLTEDFLSGMNDDARIMCNRGAMFINAFVSPELVRDYYNWRLGRDDFQPRSKTWTQHGYEGAPVKIVDGYWFIIPIMLMLSVGGLPERFAAVGMMLCILAFPREMIGYERYIRFIHAAFIFALPMVWDVVAKKRAAKCLFCLVTVWWAWNLLCSIAVMELGSINGRLAIDKLFAHGLPETIYYNRSSASLKPYASLDLLRYFVPGLQRVNIERIPESEFENSPKLNNRDYPSVFDNSFRVPKWFDINRFSTSWQIRSRESKPKGAWAASLYEFKMFWRCFAAEVPKAISSRMTGGLSSHMGAEPVRTVSHADASAEKADEMLSKWRVDVAFEDASRTDAAVTGTGGCVKWNYPKWLVRNNAKGATAEGCCSETEFTLRFHGGDRKSCIVLRGVDIRGNDKKCLPVYADFESFKINGEEKLEKPVQVWHSAPCRIPIHVKDGDILNIEVRLKPHRYDRDELRKLLLDTADMTFATEDIVDNMLSNPKLQTYLADQHIK